MNFFTNYQPSYNIYLLFALLCVPNIVKTEKEMLKNKSEQINNILLSLHYEGKFVITVI